MAYNATVLKGWGYWDTTYFPRGGAFRRAPEDIRCTVSGKSGHEYTVVFGDGRKAVVTPRALALDETK